MFKLLKYLPLIILLFSCENEGNRKLEDEISSKKEEISIISPKKANSIFSTNKTAFKYLASKKNVVIENVVSDEFSTLTSQNISSISSDSVNYGNLHNFKPFTESKAENYNILKIIFDNDIFDNTDYYYTNGLRIEFVSSFVNYFPTSILLPKLKNPDYNYQGIALVQNIYTPINIESIDIMYDDRPFSAYLTISHFKQSIDINRALSMKSEISFGVIGPASLGAVVQAGIHETEPVGWQNQIKNDVIVDYSIQIEKAIIRKKHLEGKLTTSVQLGTLYDNVSAGFSIRTGYFLPMLDNQFPGLIKLKSDKFKIWLFAKTKMFLIGYDASLQGGVFNKTSVYVISSEKINRFVLNVSAGIALYHKNMGIEFENFYVSPEYKGAYDFRYGRLNFIVSF